MTATTHVTLDGQTYRVRRRLGGEVLVDLRVEPVLTANRSAPGHWRPLRASGATAKRVINASSEA